MNRLSRATLSLTAATILAAAASAVAGGHSQQAASRNRDEEACRTETQKLQAGMAAVFRDFDAAPDPVPAELLVAIDGRIRALLRDRPRYRPCQADRELIFDSRWRQMGVATGYWDDLAYNGTLLVRAHERAPHSPLRPYTLFSSVFGATPWHGLGVMPNVKAAFAYLEEFPDGPFVEEVYRTIADFHKDLFMVLRDGRSDFKYECFRPYIRQGDRSAQRDEAQRVALEYYRRSLRLTPDDEHIRLALDLTSKGSVEGWSFCAD